jgi:flagellar biogenesis protein FliO
MQIGTLFLGILIGMIGMWVYMDREGFRDRLASVKDSAAEHAPSAEQTASAATTVWSFVKRNWLVVLIVIVLLIWGISSLVQQANQTPSINLGFNNLKDRCGVSQVVNVTIEDVRRGQVVVGTKPECRRVIILKPAQ